MRPEAWRAFRERHGETSSRAAFDAYVPVRRVRRHVWLPIFLVALTAFAVAIVTRWESVGPLAAGVVLVLAFVGLRTRLTRVVADASGLRIGETLLPTSRISVARVLHRQGEQPVVRLQAEGGVCYDVLLEHDSANALLVVLGREPSRAVMRFKTGVGSRVEVGADGVLVKGLIRRQWVPFADVADVVREVREVGEDEHRIVVVLRTAAGERISLTSYWGPNPSELDDLCERIEAAWVAFDARQAPDIGAVLARGRRTAREWIAFLGEVDPDAASYRTMPITRERLWSVLEDTASSAQVRAAAATILRVDAGDPDRSRLRIIGHSSAEPRLRVVLERIADGDDAGLCQALGALAGD